LGSLQIPVDKIYILESIYIVLRIKKEVEQKMQMSEEEWENGTAVSASENKVAVLAAFKGIKGGLDMKEIGKRSELKWPYGAVKALVEEGKLERKQFGKKFGYRLVKEE